MYYTLLLTGNVSPTRSPLGLPRCQEQGTNRSCGLKRAAGEVNEGAMNPWGPKWSERYRIQKSCKTQQQPAPTERNNVPSSVTITQGMFLENHVLCTLANNPYTIGPEVKLNLHLAIMANGTRPLLLMRVIFFFMRFIPGFFMLGIENYARVYAFFLWIMRDLCALFASLLRRSLAAPPHRVCFPAWQQDDTFEHFEIPRLLGKKGSPVFSVHWFWRPQQLLQDSTVVLLVTTLRDFTLETHI